MVKAIVKSGTIVPRSPLPADWRDGTEVEIERSLAQPDAENGTYPTDAWMDEVESLAALGDPADDDRLEAALTKIHEREKEFTRRRLGLES